MLSKRIANGCQRPLHRLNRLRWLNITTSVPTNFDDSYEQDATIDNEEESVDGNVKVLGEHEPVTTIQRKNCPIVQLRKKLQKWISIDVEGQDCDSDSISGEISDVDKKLDEDELYSSDSDEQIINVQIRHSTAFWEKQLHNMNT